MASQKNTSILAPAVAIGVIALGAVLYELFLVPAAPAPTKTPAAMPAAPLKAEVPTTPPLPPPTTSQDVPIAKVWSAYHGGSDLSGNSDAVIPEAPVVLWQYLAEGAIQQPAVADEQAIYVATTTGSVVALDFKGTERWKKKLTRIVKDSSQEATERLPAPIACFRATVLVGSNAGILHALDAASGTEKWTYDIGGEILGAATPFATANDVRVVMIERGNGALHCLDLETGKRIWKSDDVARCDGSAAVANGMVVYGSCASAFHVHAAEDGKRIRNVDLCSDCQVACGPAFVGDDIYAGARGGFFYRVESRTGRIVWRNQDSAEDVFTTPALSKDLVIFGSDDGGVYALDRENGDKKWRFETGKTPSSPVIAGDKVIFGADGVLQILKLESGAPVWNYEVSDGIAAPSIINGMIVVGSEDGTVVALGSKAG